MNGRRDQVRSTRWVVLVLGGASALFACNGSARSASEEITPKKTAEKSAPDSQPATAKPAPAPLVAARREIMGTWFELKVVGDDTPATRALLERGLDEVARLEQVLSEWQPQTEISRINQGAGGAPLKVGDDTLAVLRAGLDVSRWSQGAFDMSWAAMRELYKFEPGKEPVLPRKEDVERLRKLVGYHDILVDEREKTVRLARKGMALGTGGIAKGYALDRVGAMLESAGHKDYLLFAGGQVLVHGSRGGRAWRIGIKHPRENQRTIGFIELDQGSVSTSGDYEHYFMVGGRRFHHIIDLSTGYPSESSVSVTLIAPSGIHADALSTACFVLGRERCVKMLAEVPGGAHAVIIDADMRVHVTEGIRDRVHLDQGFLDAARP